MDLERERAYKSWKKFLDPNDLKANLVRASVYLSSYELLKSAVVENPRGFFNMGHSPVEEDSPEYQAEVIALHPKDRFHASCLWFKKMEAIDDDDMTMIGQIRTHRNDIAHELPKYLADSRFAINMQLLDMIHVMVGKIERWWIREIEMAVNPDFYQADVESIPDNEVQSGNMIMMDLINKIIHGQDQELTQLLEVFRKVWRQEQGSSNKTTGDDL